MSTKIKPQKDDVWESKGNVKTKIQILFVGDKLGIGLKPGGEVWFAVEGLTSSYELIERNGKPYPFKKERKGRKLIGFLCLVCDSKNSLERHLRLIEEYDRVFGYYDGIRYWAVAAEVSKEVVLKFRNFHGVELDTIPCLGQSPWPLRDVVTKLCEASDILLDHKNYDGQGHEIISIAREKAREFLKMTEE